MAAQAGDTIYDEQRAPLTLGRLLKRGGAGSVFLIKERPLEGAKLYHSDKGGQVYERKVRAMLELQRAVRTLTGLELDRIEIVKSKG